MTIASSSAGTSGRAADGRGIGISSTLQIVPRLLSPANRSERQHLVQHDAEREDVDARVDRTAAQRLGRQVRRLALDRAVLGVAPRGAVARDAEVEQLERARRRQHDVRRRDVAMDDAQRLAVAALQAVDVVERAADLVREVRRDRDRHELPAERSALHRAISDGPSTYSSTRNSVPSASPKS